MTDEAPTAAEVEALIAALKTEGGRLRCMDAAAALAAQAQQKVIDDSLLREWEKRATKAEAALAERDKECDALRKAIGNALYSMSGYAPPEFNSASGILMNAIGKLDAAIAAATGSSP